MSTVAMYFFQGELGESMEYPNAFVIPKTAQPTLELFLSYFPIRDLEDMHFRFRRQDAEYGYVWADVSSPAEPLPFFEGCIMAKVLRVSEAATMHRQVLLKRKKKETLANQGAAQLHAPADAEVRHRSSAAPNATSEAKPAPYRDYDPSAMRSDAPQQSRQPQQPQGPSPTRKESVNIASGAAPATAEAEDILSFDDGGVPSSGAAAPAAARAAEMPQSEAKVLDRNELRMAKEQGIQDKVKQALDEKKEKDRIAEQEQQDFDSAKEKHEAKLLAWATNNKEKRNIRTLLSTMHVRRFHRKISCAMVLQVLLVMLNH